eukprot:Hpha_TRINITY_DN15370_c3_g6::TRINITY_DN15370_c3_g6_i1::g.87420::m.87420
MIHVLPTTTNSPVACLVLWCVPKSSAEAHPPAAPGQRPRSTPSCTLPNVSGGDWERGEWRGWVGGGVGLGMKEMEGNYFQNSVLPLGKLLPRLSSPRQQPSGGATRCAVLVQLSQQSFVRTSNADELSEPLGIQTFRN